MFQLLSVIHKDLVHPVCQQFLCLFSHLIPHKQRIHRMACDGCQFPGLADQLKCHGMYGLSIVFHVHSHCAPFILINPRFLCFHIFHGPARTFLHTQPAHSAAGVNFHLSIPAADGTKGTYVNELADAVFIQPFLVNPQFSHNPLSFLSIQL